MRSSASKIQMTGFDDLFQTEPKAEVNGERVQEIPLAELHPFKNHPFQVRDDEAMQETADSIAKYGVLVPGIVRPRPEGGYEIVAGHRRKRGSELAGKETMPVIVRNLDDDDAILIMVDSNLQREEILPSEKAFAYKMKLDAMKRKAGRPSQNYSQLGNNFSEQTSSEQLATQMGESKNQIFCYVRLTYLIPELLNMTDDGKLAFNPAVELSYLKPDEQSVVYAVMERNAFFPSIKQAQKMKKHSKDGILSVDVIEEILKKESPVTIQVTLKRDRLKQYFPGSYTSQQMEEVIISLLKSWHIQQQ